MTEHFRKVPKSKPPGAMRPLKAFFIFKRGKYGEFFATFCNCKLIFSCSCAQADFESTAADKMQKDTGGNHAKTINNQNGSIFNSFNEWNAHWHKLRFSSRN